MSNVDESPLHIPADGHELLGLLHTGDGPVAALLLHPHPQYGGDMDNHVVTTLGGVLAEERVSTLRFNFRRSGGAGEPFDVFATALADARAAAAGLRDAASHARTLAVAGYSFGAAVAATVAADARADALILVSLPGQAAASLPDGIPTLIVTGDRDEIAPPGCLLRLEAPGRDVVIIEGADHFWATGSDRLAAAVRSFLGNLQVEQ